MKIILIGFMGVGKSTVGNNLAEVLHKPFIDLDSMIEEHTGQSIPNFFSKVGEGSFRTIEANLLTKALQMEEVVISTGGGVVETRQCVDILRKSGGLVIWLNGTFSTVTDRLLNTVVDRPLLSGKPLPDFFNLWKRRQNIYADTANFEVITDHKNITEISNEIIQHMDHPTKFDTLRSQIDSFDNATLQQLAARMTVVDQVALIKKNHKIPVLQTARMANMRQRLNKAFVGKLSNELIEEYMSFVTGAAISREEQQI